MNRTSGAGNIAGKFVAEDVATNRPPTEITAEWLNGVQEELLAVIAAAGIAPDVLKLNQLKLALDAIYLAKNGSSPILQNFAGLTRSVTPLGGALIREYVDIANAATVGGIEIGIVYNCAIDPVTGVWAGRDIADICWIEKWHDAAGTKEIWMAATAAAGVAPVWLNVYVLNSNTGDMSVSGNLKSASASFTVSPSLGVAKNINGQNLNGIYVAGFYDGAGLVNSPLAGWVYVLVQNHSNSIATNIYCKQMLFDFASNRMFSRYCYGNAWTAWTEILDVSAADLRYLPAGGNAAQVVSVAPAVLATHAINLGQAYGIAQTWQNVTATRVLGTVYTNTTGKLIKLIVQCNATAAGSGAISALITLGGVSTSFNIAAGCNTAGGYSMIGTVDVPIGASCTITSTAALAAWIEMR